MQRLVSKIAIVIELSNEQAIEQSWVQRLVSKLAIVIELSNEQAIEQSWVLHKIGSSKRSP